MIPSCLLGVLGGYEKWRDNEPHGSAYNVNNS